ncbi:acyloxyacyl hydrolase [Modicisalibacter ilicicola]|uniref:acyloxyacyl hydrolase n=1 Tax=Modicisalibacter ilicicola TaxID=480814 RepID=UPI0015876335|nr:acyloxyacyl hydrolase [Halomonas ilicicola]
MQLFLLQHHGLLKDFMLKNPSGPIKNLLIAKGMVVIRLRLASAPSLLLMLAVAGLLASGPIDAQDRTTIGIRAGTLATDRQADFTQYEAFLAHDLPWRWRLGTDWVLGTRLNASLGVLRSGDEESLIGTIGPGLTLHRAGSPWIFDAGTSLAGLDKDVFRKKDIGGQFQFSSSIALNYRFESVSLGYRFMHLSNGGLSDPNPGLDMHMLELGRHL